MIQEHDKMYIFIFNNGLSQSKCNYGWLYPVSIAIEY